MSLAGLSGLIRSLLIYRGHPLRAARMRRFYAGLVQPGSLCFDIGAHVGDRIACFRALGAQVVALEPQPLLYRTLRLLHGLDRQVSLHQTAVGRVAGRAQLHLNRRNPILSTLSPVWKSRVAASTRFPGERWETEIQVAVTTIDLLIDSHGMPDFIKIDAEGFESDILDGMTRPVPALSLEYLPETLDQARDCLWKLAALGPYRFNASRGESFRWMHGVWLSPAEMAEWLRRRPEDDPGGDLYAALDPPSLE